MITQDTIIITGAGSSFPYGYPTGERLKSIICSTFHENFMQLMSASRGSDYYRFEELKALSREFIDIFRKSHITIDHFLSINHNYKEIGKIAIALTIMNEEKKSVSTWQLDRHDQDWFSYLYERMIDGLTHPEGYKIFGENKVKFITFNYDRLLEHFLYESFTNSFPNIDKQYLIEQLAKIDIYHVYGKVADLQWESQNGLEYKQSFDYHNIEIIKDNIHIIGEDKTHNIVDDAISIINNTKNIYFIGFGYANENLDVLNLPQILEQKHKVFGTALDWSTKKIDDITNLLSTRNRGSKKYGVDRQNIQILNCDSRALFEDWL